MTDDGMRPATDDETAAWLAGHSFIPDAIETDHGLMVPTTEPEPWAREALAGLTSEDETDDDDDDAGDHSTPATLDELFASDYQGLLD